MTITMTISRVTSLLLPLLLGCIISTMTSAAPLQFYDFRSAYLRQQSPRALQTSGGTLPDLIAPTSNCFTQGGLEFACMIHQRIGTSEDYVDLNATVVCELGVSQFDFRRSNGCSCSVLITPSNTTKLPKTCPCFVCPVDFGSSSLSLDCSMYIPSESPSMAPNSDDAITGGVPGDQTMPPTSATMTEAPTAMDGGTTTMPPTSAGTSTTTTLAPTSTSTSTTSLATATGAPSATSTVVSPFLSAAPTASQSVAARRILQEDTAVNTTANTTEAVPDPFIFSTCVTIDCGGNCNGTCSLGCDVSGTQCAFCEGAAGRPTPSPTGAGDGTIDELSGAMSGMNMWSRMLSLGVVAVAAVLV